MSRRVILRTQVPVDIESILMYLRERSSDAADRFADGLDGTLTELAAMPGKGSLKPFRSKQLSGIRSWSMPHFRSYLIFYRPIDEGIEVIAIVHGARRIAKILKDRV
jgi:toxin ParE1/3/4